MSDPPNAGRAVDFYANRAGEAISSRTLGLQGTSHLAGNFQGLSGATVDEIVSRVPSGWKWAPLRAGNCLFLFDTAGFERVRLLGPSANAPVGSNSQTGWTLRIMDVPAITAMVLDGLYSIALTRVIYQFTEIQMPLESHTTGKLPILRDIARIGSLPFQEEVCLRGTIREYVLLDELIEVAVSRVELECRNEALARKWSEQERKTLQEFADRVNALFDRVAWRDKDVSLVTIIKDDPAMGMIRDTAKNCLQQLRVSFSLEELLAD